jgi:hypothetical protein
MNLLLRSLAPGEFSSLAHTDAWRERVGMTMRQPPFRPVTAKDLCDTQ